MLFGWLPADVSETHPVISSMAAALRVSDGEQVRLWPTATLGIGVMERPFGDEDASMEPARGHDGSMLWMSGEAFDWPSHGGLRSAAESRTPAFRSRLLEAVVARGPEAIADLDGEYQIAVWQPQTRTLQLLNDRFGALPMYVASSRHGTAFGGGVRGVVLGPGISCEPDTQAIREAVTFGGYRLGSRTNIRDVRMVPPASAVTISPTGVTTKRYWTWSELRLKPEPTELKLREGDAADEQEFLEEARASWRAAIAKRLDGSRRPGLTLSGGLDSRAILAEASRQQRRVRALTYGVPQSDDVKIARRAARAADADWELFPLYAEGWLERRTRRILETDGLMDLVDLMHTELLDTLPSAFDVYLSGYIGDAVAGSTLFFGSRPEDFLATMPYYGGELALSYGDARRMAEEMIAATPGAPRFAPYEHKLPQSTNRITAAARPFALVRRPFVDYRFFELCQQMPPAWRMGHRWRERWLVSTYPECFARIPNQQTGVPPQSSRLRWQLTRTARFAWRRVLGAAKSAGLRVSVPERSYHPDERYWSEPAARAQLEGTILRNGSICCEVFGRARVAETLRDFFQHRANPVQVIGALYVFERYHQTLAASLASARQKTREYAC
jgi:asparagine synthase (glutamine-hydrolysing)